MNNNLNYLNQWEEHFNKNRAFLISFTFRMTGSLAEAEDLVQDVFLECTHINPDEIRSHKSWLTKLCSNKALDHLKSAYKRRETYKGPWLPDAVPDRLQLWGNLEESALPDKQLLLTESLTTSFLLLIEKLTPEERVIYLLNEVFDYSFNDIALFLNKSDAACRKTAERARKAIQSEKIKFDSIPKNSEELISHFFETARNGDEQGLIELLADNSAFWGDGGGKVSSIHKVMNEKSKIARFFSSMGKMKAFDPSKLKIEFNYVNSLPGLVLSRQLPDGEWAFDTIYSFEFIDGKIGRIYAQRNPDKLEQLLKIRSLLP
jgi:RNA polymerase sigma-70 factor (ECF subfamily)